MKAAIALISMVFAGSAMADTAGDSDLNEIVVTAQRRTEDTVKVPIAVSVESASDLRKANVVDVASLQQLVPGFNVTSAGANSQPTIRGVGSQVAGPGLSSNVATYIDGFYQPNEITNNVKFGDISSVEVLKGPQGTLYGRNATGGAILITTSSPGTEPTADIDVSYGNFNSSRVAIFASAPLTSTLSASVSFLRDGDDGYTRNIYTGHEEGHNTTTGIRAKLLYSPTEDLSFELGVIDVDINDPNAFMYGNYKGQSDGALFPGAVVATQPNQVSSDFSPLFKSHTNGINLKGNLNFDGLTLTSYSSFENQGDNRAYDLDGTSTPVLDLHFPGVDKTWQQEFDLSSGSNDKFTWISGLFYLHDDAAYTISLATPPYSQLETGRVVTNSVAGFAEGTYNVVENLFLTAGLRYSHDQLQEFYAPVPVPAPAPQPPFNTTFNKVTPRVVLRYDLTPHQSVYASFNQGYKSGAYNALGLSPEAVKPESINAYEVGYKSSEGGWNIDAAAFDYDYKDLQVSSYEGGATILTNAASAKLYGFDGRIARELLQGLTADIGFSFVHSRYASFTDAPHYEWDPTTGVSITPGNATGERLPNAPQFTGQLGLTYDHDLPFGSGEVNANYAYQSTTYFDSFDQTSQSGYGLLNLRAAVYSPDKRYSIYLYGRNVTDKHYYETIVEQTVAFSSKWAAPRTYGIGFTVHL